MTWTRRFLLPGSLGLAAALAVSRARSDPKDGPPPSIAVVQVSDDEIRVEFEWLADPNIDPSRALELGLLIAKPDNYLMPASGEDIDPTTGATFSGPPNEFPCPYRDVYNYSVGSTLTFYSGLVEYCGYPGRDTKGGYSRRLRVGSQGLLWVPPGGM